MKLRAKILIAAACMAVPLIAMSAPSGTDQTCVAHGKASFRAFVHGHYSKVTTNFLPSNKPFVTTARVKQSAQKLKAKYGVFKSLGAFHARTLDGQKVFVAPLVYANGRLIALFACDAKGRIVRWGTPSAQRFPGLLPAAPATAATHP